MSSECFSEQFCGHWLHSQLENWSYNLHLCLFVKFPLWNLYLSVTHSDIIFLWIIWANEMNVFEDLTTTVVGTVMCLFCFLFELFPNSLWKLMNQWKENFARITIVSGWRLNLSPPAYLNCICLSLALWDWGEGFALRPLLFSTAPWRRSRLTGFKRKLQVPSPGLCQSRFELVSPHR